MYNFAIQAYSSYKGLFHWLNWRAYISIVFINPIIQVIMFSILGSFAVGQEKAQLLTLGISVQLMSSIVLSGITQSYSNEIRLKTLPFVYVSQVNRLVNFLSRPVLHYPNALIVFTCGMITAWIIVDINFEFINWVGFIIAILVIAASITAFAQFLGAFTIIFKDWLYTSSLANGILLSLTGAIIPTTVFPVGLQEFTKLLPITNGLFAVRNLFMGASFTEVSGYIFREFLIGLGYCILGLAVFLVFEKVVKQTGTLNLEA